MDKKYTKTNWKNNETRLNATNMNHIEDGIETLYNEALDENSLIPGNSAKIDKVGDKLRIGVDIVEITEHLQASGYVEDPEYTHTDNNYTDAEKQCLEDLGTDVTALNTEQGIINLGPEIYDLSSAISLVPEDKRKLGIMIQYKSESGWELRQFIGDDIEEDWDNTENWDIVGENTEIDNTPTEDSPNAVSSGGVYEALSEKQNVLVSGTDIKTLNNESLLGSGNISIEIPTTTSDLINDSDFATTSDVSNAVSGKQNEITAQNKLNADLVDDSNSSNKFVTATEKVGAEKGNTALQGVILNGTELVPDSNKKVSITSINGSSAYEIAVENGYSGTEQEWLDSLHASIGEFMFVANDPTAEAALTTYGSTYTSAISGASPSSNTLSTILLMNDDDTTPTKTMMIATEDDGNSGYQFVYVGDLNNALPSNILTETDIVNDLSTGGSDKVLSAEMGKEIGHTVTDVKLAEGVVEFEQGSFGNSGVESSSNTRIRTKVIDVPFSAKLKGAWQFFELYEYNYWNSNADFELVGRTIINNSAISINPSTSVFRVSVRKTNNATITVEDFLSVHSELKLIVDNLTNKVTSLETLPGTVQTLSGEAVKTSHQNLTSTQKDTARNNIEAMAQLYTPIATGDGLYEYLGADEVYTDANILSMDNVFDKTHILSNKSIDSSGNLVDHQYYCVIDVLIPVYGGVKLICNYSWIMVALYKTDGTFIHLDGGSISANTVYTLNATMYQQQIGYVRLIFGNTTAITNKNAIMVSMIKKSDESPIIPQEYVPFGMYQGGLVPSRSFVYNSDFSQFQLKEKSDNSIIGLLQNYFPTETLFSDITPWEPTTVDSGYSNPTGGWGNDTYRADWSATDKYMYYEFLAHYYDTYLGSHDNGTYHVTKRGLWQDGAHTGHEVFEYRFTPINYKYTVMLSAGMNADETQGIWGLATFIRCLMNEEEPNMVIMKKNIRFIIIPIINASGFDQSRLRYTYSNGVNPNYNFNYKDSWEQNTASVALKGDYPDSNVETQGLKRWINEYSGVALLYVDLHTGRFQQNNDPTATSKTILDVRFGNTSPYYNDFNNVHRPLVKQFYVDKGYITNDDYIGGASSVATSIDYQKHAYAVQVCGINSAMPEMHIESTGYGSDGLTNNSTYGIKGYVLQIRQIIMFVVNKFISEHSTIALVGNNEVRLQNNYK